MAIILAVGLGTVVVAPFFGRWRARVWLKRNGAAKQMASGLLRPGLHEPNV